MSNYIQILDDQTINQIAAGEVIENAASCVKELVENSIDAGADNIIVSFSAGGRKKIEIIDNGCGMNFEDARLALERHATSKIQKIGDMDTIATMGFRGEALPSIASISKFILETSDGEVASKVVLHGGKLIDHSVSTRPRGTTIEVGSLFYNVPARREFQKSTSYDNREIVKTMMDLALAHPKIAFKVLQDGKETFNLIPKKSFTDLQNLHYRIETLFGRQTSDELIEVEVEKEGITLKGFIAKAKVHRPNRLGQHLFVNCRAVASWLIALAIREGYSTRLPEGRFPIFFLSISLDPKMVDVNVHPQKKELRFKDSFEVKRRITSMIDAALRTSSVPDIARPLVDKEVFFESTFSPSEPRMRSAEQVFVIEKKQSEYFPDPVLEFVPNIIGLFSSYIFVEAKSISTKISLQRGEEMGLIMVHQKRADERILFDALVQRGASLSIQNLLMPKTLEFSEVESSIVDEYLPTFEALGISIRSIGKNSFILDGLPNLIPIEAAQDLIESVLEEIKAGGTKSSIEEQRKQILAMAISKSVSFPKNEDIEKAKVLLTKLFKCENFEYSPKGKPILLPLTLDELSKKFK